MQLNKYVSFKISISSIKFKVIECGQPGVAGGGTKQFYASANMDGEQSLAGITRSIEKISTVSGADIRAVLYALVDVMTERLAEGRALRLAELGSVRVSISSEGKPTAEEVNSSCIRNSKVIFSPGAGIKTMLKTLKYEKL